MPKQNLTLSGKEIRKQIKGLPKEKIHEYFNTVSDRLDSDCRSQVYEANHERIILMIRNYILSHDCSPAINDIAEKTNLSRKTIYSHLQSFDTSEFYDTERRKRKMVAESLINKLGVLAHNGDVRAAKLFLQVTGYINQNTNVLHLHQNNKHDGSVIKDFVHGEVLQDSIGNVREESFVLGASTT